MINALTLYSVMQADLVPVGDHSATKGHTPIVQFFVNVQILAGKEKEQAAILFGMLFTLIIWVFSALSLLLAVIFYIVFLWHHIRDGSLSKYCRRKIDTRLHQIVKKKVNKALNRKHKAWTKQEERDIKAGVFKAPAKRQPKLPVLDTEETQNFAPISRQTTQAEISPFDSRPPSRTSHTQSLLRREPTVPSVLSREPTIPAVMSREPTLPNLINGRPQPPSRMTTQGSLSLNQSYADDAPLLDSAGAMGYQQASTRRAPSRMDSERTFNNMRPPPGHSSSRNTHLNARVFNSSAAGMGRPSRTDTDVSARTATGSFTSQPSSRKPIPLNTSFDHGGGPSVVSGASRGLNQEIEMQTPNAANRPNAPSNESSYMSFNPTPYYVTGSIPSSGQAPSRSFTQPLRPPQYDYFGSIPRPSQRSGTAPIPQFTAYDSAQEYIEQRTDWQQPRDQAHLHRPATTDPYGRRPLPPRS